MLVIGEPFLSLEKTISNVVYMTKAFAYFWKSLEDEGEAKKRAERVLRIIKKYK